MLGTQLFASATALMLGQILPPSEMKSLYGSTTKSAVISLLYSRIFTASLLGRWDWRGSPTNAGIPEICETISGTGEVFSSWTEVQCPLWVKSRHVQCNRP